MFVLSLALELENKIEINHLEFVQMQHEEWGKGQTNPTKGRVDLLTRNDKATTSMR